MSRAFDRPGRSGALGREAMVATSHPDASIVAVDVLRQGGTAVDAAIAAAAVLAVVEPAETGIGGDCFALVAPGGRVPPLAFNGSGRAPAGVSAARLRARGLATIPADGADAVTVPGAVDAWVQLHGRFGRRPLASLLEPAIALAEEGYVVQERVALEWERGAARLAGHAEAAAIFLPEGRPPAAGTVMRNPALAATLRRIAAEGRAAFYEGPVGAAMVDTLARLGGSHTAADFAACRGEFVEPLAAPYRGRQIWQLPPNTQGAIALLILRLMARWPPAREGFLSFEHVHRMIEVARIAYARRGALLGDAEASGPLVALLADEARLDALAATVDPHAAGTEEVPRGEATDTVYLAVVDGDGTAVSFINSIFHSFGSGICPPGTGVLLQNRGAGFSLEERHSNALAPGRRPMHTLIPAMVEHEGAVEIVFGVMGGDYQPMGHAHVLTAMLDYAMTPQEACDAPRFLPVGDAVEVEDAMPADVVAALAAAGQRIRRPLDPHGGAQIVRIARDRGILVGGSDPRKDGFAVGLTAPPPGIPVAASGEDPAPPAPTRPEEDQT